MTARHRRAPTSRRRSVGGGPLPGDGFRAVLAVREYRRLWLADVQSLVGDQLARVALSVLVYSHTGSGLLTAGVYALTYLPSLLAGVLLGRLADRLPPRSLLVAGDLIRAGLLALMAVPAVPLPLVVVFLVLAVVVGTPWKAAESALVAEILAGEGYVVGVGLRVATVQAAQLIGFAVGGAVVAAVGARTALGVDAGTFAVSAALMRWGLARRAAAGGSSDGPERASWWSGISVAFATERLRVLLGLSWLAGLFVVPEGLAAPYAASVHGGPGTVGVFLAANPAGMLVAAVLFSRWLPAQVRSRAVGPMAVAAGLPLLGFWAAPSLALATILLALSGAASAYQIQVMTEFVTTVPRAGRGQAIAVASSGLLAAQGLGLIAGGALAQVWHVEAAIAVAGAVGTLSAAGLAVAHQRSSGHRSRSASLAH